MADFILAHKITSLNEGGYVNDPNDKGGETYRGISRRMHPDWKGWMIVDNYKKIKQLGRNEFINSADLEWHVESFYKENFWNINNLSALNNQEIANELFDTGVNMGTKTAAKFLQKAINLLNRNQKDYQDIDEDGIIGSITINLVNTHKYQNAVLRTINGLQFMKYVEICERDKSQENNFRGWLKRV